MIGFGIDLAGYTTGKTSLAVIKIDGRRATAILLRESALSTKRESHSPLKEILRQEVAVLRRCLMVGPVAVDIPIDLQGLPFPHAPNELWELTRRPIDKKLRAMAPFADRIGAPVSRFAAMRRHSDFSGVLGQNLFETYPAAIWEKLGIDASGYKSQQRERAEAACAALCKRLKIVPALMNDDDIDAIICAVVAVAPEVHLCSVEDYGIGSIPCGFRLIKQYPFEDIRVDEANFSEWMDSREKQK
jgi:hypothetical protein